MAPGELHPGSASGIEAFKLPVGCGSSGGGTWLAGQHANMHRKERERERERLRVPPVSCLWEPPDVGLAPTGVWRVPPSRPLLPSFPHPLALFARLQEGAGQAGGGGGGASKRHHIWGHSMSDS